MQKCRSFYDSRYAVYYILQTTEYPVPDKNMYFQCVKVKYLRQSRRLVTVNRSKRFEKHEPPEGGFFKQLSLALIGQSRDLPLPAVVNVLFLSCAPSALPVP